MLHATIHRSRHEATCRGHRHWLRVRTGEAAGHLRVESARIEEGRWRPVDHDLVALTRAVSRIVAIDAELARTLVRHAAELAEIVPRDPAPVTGLVRATYPLLASPPPWPLASVPVTLPVAFQPAFRVRTPRQAARRLFGDRTTRPVVRALSELLTVDSDVDVFLLSLAVMAAPLLEPDHLARLLAARATPDCDRAALEAGHAARLRLVLGDTPPRRLVRLLTDAATDPATRRRLRFVASECPADLEVDPANGWADLALAVAVATG